MDLVIVNNVRWYALHTHRLQEERASENLNAWGVETFSPKYRERRPNPYTGRPVYFTRPLFPRYIFARFDAGRSLRKVWFTRGVHRVVGFGDGPTPVEDEIIELFKSRVGPDGLIQFNQEFKPGDKVIIRDGPLANLQGIFERDIEDGERVSMLLTAISYQGRVTIERQFLKKIS
jgi:transcription elongation factor/antiterminator RfaH